MARSLFGLSIRPIAVTKFVGTVSLGLLTGLSYTTTTLTLPSLHLLPSATTASNTTHHLRAATWNRCLYLSLLSTLSLSLSYMLSPRGRRHPFLLYAALSTALPLSVDVYNSYFPATPTSGGDGKINMRDMSMPSRQHSASSAASSGAADEEWEVDASGMRGNGNGSRTPGDSASEGEEAGGEVNGESVREGMRSWGQGVARRGVVWGVGFAIAVVGLWGDGA